MQKNPKIHNLLVDLVPRLPLDFALTSFAMYCFLLFSCCSPIMAEEIKVDKGLVFEKVLLDGVLKPQKSQDLIAPFSGAVLSILEDGASVKKNDLIASFDTWDISQEFFRNQFSWEIEQKELKKLKLSQKSEKIEDETRLLDQKKDYEIKKILLNQKLYSRSATEITRKQLELKKSKNMLQFFSTHIKELEKLSHQGALSSTEFNEEKLKFSEYQIRLEQLQIDLQKLKEGDLLQIERAKKEVEKSKIRLEFLEKQILENENLRNAEFKVKQEEVQDAFEKMEKSRQALENSKIYAGTNGIFVAESHWIGGGMGPYEAGHRIEKNSRFGMIATSGEICGVFTVMEKDLSLLELSQPVSFRINPLGNLWFRGKVSKLGNSFQEVSRWDADFYSLKTAEVQMEILDVNPNMKPKMTFIAMIERNRRENVLRVPARCVENNFVNTPAGTKKIKVGVIGSEWIEVLEGLTLDELILCKDAEVSNSPLQRSHLVQTMTFFENVSGSGELRSKSESFLTPVFSSTIKKLEKQGEFKKGEPLVVLDVKEKETEFQAKEIELSENTVELNSVTLEKDRESQSLIEELKELEMKLSVQSTELAILSTGNTSLNLKKKEIEKKISQTNREFQELQFEIQKDLKDKGYLKSTEFQNTLAALENAKIEEELKTLELELDSSSASDNEILKQKFEVDFLKSSLENKKKILDLKKRIGGINVEIAQTRLKSSEYEVLKLKETIEKGILKAPKDGFFMIQERWNQGKFKAWLENDAVQPGAIIGSFFQMDEFYIAGSLPEKSFHLLQIGQKVDFFLSGRKDQVFEGILQKIASIPVTDSVFNEFGDPMVNVRIDVDSKSRNFQPGNSVQYKVKLSTPREGLAIPFRSVYGHAKKAFVFLSRDRKIKKEIKTGYRNGEWIEVLEGLKEKDTVWWEEVE